MKYDYPTPKDFGELLWSLNANTQREQHFAVVSPEEFRRNEPKGIDANTDPSPDYLAA